MVATTVTTTRLGHLGSRNPFSLFVSTGLSSSFLYCYYCYYYYGCYCYYYYSYHYCYCCLDYAQRSSSRLMCAERIRIRIMMTLQCFMSNHLYQIWPQILSSSLSTCSTSFILAQVFNRSQWCVIVSVFVASSVLLIDD